MPRECPSAPRRPAHRGGRRRRTRRIHRGGQESPPRERSARDRPRAASFRCPPPPRRGTARPPRAARSSTRRTSARASSRPDTRGWRRAVPNARDYSSSNRGGSGDQDTQMTLSRRSRQRGTTDIASSQIGEHVPQPATRQPPVSEPGADDRASFDASTRLYNAYGGALIRELLSGHRIDGVIGRGGMGVVYRAHLVASSARRAQGHRSRAPRRRARRARFPARRTHRLVDRSPERHPGLYTARGRHRLPRHALRRRP